MIEHGPLTLADLKPNTINLFRADGGPLIKTSKSSTNFMVKGRLFRRWVFVYHKNIMKPGVTYQIR